MLPTHYILHNISYRVFKKIFVFFEFLKILVTCLFFPWKLKSICKNQILTKQTLYSNCLVGPWHPQSSPVLHRRALMGSASPKVTHNYPGLPPTSQLLYNIFFSDPFEILYGGQLILCENLCIYARARVVNARTHILSRVRAFTTRSRALIHRFSWNSKLQLTR